MAPYKIIDHTSDVGIEVRATSFEELFLEAIKGLIWLIIDKNNNEIDVSGFKKGRVKVVLRYSSIEDGLIELLNRIIILTYSKGFLLLNPSVKIKKRKIILKGIVLKGAFSLMEREIKAATYHNFSIKRDNSHISTTIIFDI